MRVLTKEDIKNLKDGYNKMLKRTQGHATGFAEALCCLGLLHNPFALDRGSNCEQLYVRYRGRDYESPFGHCDVDELLDTLADYIRYHIVQVEKIICTIKEKGETDTQEELLLKNLNVQLKKIAWIKSNAAEVKEV